MSNLTAIKKTKFYPVDIDNKLIIDAPEPRERDLAWKWRGKRVVGLRGSHLIKTPLYKTFSVIKLVDSDVSTYPSQKRTETVDSDVDHDEESSHASLF